MTATSEKEGTARSPRPDGSGTARPHGSLPAHVDGRRGSLLVLVVLLGCHGSEIPNAATAVIQPPSTAETLAALSEASERISTATRRTVVKVEAEPAAGEDSAADELDRLFGRPAAPVRAGQGSGVIVAADGDVLTNYHVIRHAAQVWVTGVPAGRIAARVVGVDALTDLALLKIDARDLPAIEWGDSDALSVGALVWAVGSPYALEQSVSFGILSAKDREGLTASPFQEFLQTDAAINPGNSGGALVDVHGRLVGINTAVIGPSYRGIGFAIPSRTARQVYERLRSNGRVPRGWLGVALDTVTPQRAVQLGMAAPEGAYVAAVTRDARQPSPAEAAGIRAGDVIVRWQGQPIEDPVRLSRLVAASPIGSVATAVLYRDGQSREVQVAIGEQPAP